MSLTNSPLSVCAVNYLNTVPLVWGMMHGPQQSQVQLSFEIPSVCAEVVEQRRAQAGLVPVAEISRLRLEVAPGYGIACRGAVRSILLISRTPVRDIKTLAADLSSRTSVQLARVVLREMYGVQPEFVRRRPDLDAMLAECDAALIIGDPALPLDPYALPFDVLDLGAEWYALTGLPMVFALWAGRAIGNNAQSVFEASYRFGQRSIDEIVDHEWEKRGITAELAHEYLSRYIHYEIGESEWKGLEAFLSLAGLPSVHAVLAEAR